MFFFFLRGVLLGFSIAAPVGPIGVLCIRRTLVNGRVSGFISGAGAATADALYGSVAALGLSAIAERLVASQDWLRLGGGAYLLYLGAHTYLAQPADQAFRRSINNLADEDLANSPDIYRRETVVRLVDYLSTFLLTLTNPLTILTFAAIFAGLGVVESDGTPLPALLLVAGIFAGSSAWWLILSNLADKLRERFLKPGALRRVNRISGALISAFGLAALASLLWK